MLIAVETEISREIIGDHSPRVQLIAFDIDNDVGLFKLHDSYADQKNFINIDWIMERDDAYSTRLQFGVAAACCGYSESLSELQSEKIQLHAAQHLSQKLVNFLSISIPSQE